MKRLLCAFFLAASSIHAASVNTGTATGGGRQIPANGYHLGQITTTTETGNADSCRIYLDANSAAPGTQKFIALLYAGTTGNIDTLICQSSDTITVNASGLAYYTFRFPANKPITASTVYYVGPRCIAQGATNPRSGLTDNANRTGLLNQADPLVSPFPNGNEWTLAGVTSPPVVEFFWSSPGTAVGRRYGAARMGGSR